MNDRFDPDQAELGDDVYVKMQHWESDWFCDHCEDFNEMLYHKNAKKVEKTFYDHIFWLYWENSKVLLFNKLWFVSAFDLLIGQYLELVFERQSVFL